MMHITLIAAVARNRVIGKNNDLIWHMPEDLKFFKKTTLGHSVVMGRKTFESFGRPLPGRTNIVLSRSKKPVHPDVVMFSKLEDAIVYCKENGEDECFIAGGAEIYQQALPLADRMIITEIHAEFEGDTFFPDFNPQEWKEISRDKRKKDTKNPYDYSFVIYEKSVQSR
jgi:dihydrofolate reductase